MQADDRHTLTWEHRQAELWDRIFQVTSDVVTVADSLEDGTGSSVVKQEMVRAAMAVGTELVRANAADSSPEFREHLKEARLRAIETDYWLRMAYVLQQREDIQRDLSSVITQYSGIVELLERFLRHTKTEKNVLAKHAKGPRIS